MIEQHTSEWEKLRQNSIGSSDAPVIMEVSPYKTPYQLWEEKMGLDEEKSPTAAMRRGLELEDQARQELEKLTGLFFLPYVKFHPSHSWMMASLDGIDAEHKYVTEIKCPNKEDHAIALAGKIPDKYFPQVQHQLEVCELEMAYYFSWNGTGGAIVKIYRDEKYIKKMVDRERDFWERVQNFSPPPFTEKDYNQRVDETWTELAHKWKEIHRQKEELERAEKEVRDSLISLSQSQNTIGGGIRLTRGARKGAIDYDAIPDIKNINLEKYRKPSSSFVRVSSV
jgi:putative phage-type endonuclease